MTPLALIDSNYLCQVARYAIGPGLRYEGNPTGIIYGFLARICSLGQELCTNRFVFCWDSRKSLRRNDWPSYKANRKPQTPEEERENQMAYVQFKAIRRHVLPTMGFRNVFVQPGIEADDLLAQLAMQCVEKGRKAYIVTADLDLYQCLAPGVVIYNPRLHEKMTRKKFRRDYGIKVCEWPTVKAIAGCPSDNIKGVPGVGEVTALKFVRGELGLLDRRAGIIRENKAEIERCRMLTRLPYPGTKPMTIRKDRLSMDGFRQVIEKYGMDSWLYDDSRWRAFFEGQFDA